MGYYLRLRARYHSRGSRSIRAPLSPPNAKQDSQNKPSNPAAPRFLLDKALLAGRLSFQSADRSDPGLLRVYQSARSEDSHIPAVLQSLSVRDPARSTKSENNTHRHPTLSFFTSQRCVWQNESEPHVVQTI